MSGVCRDLREDREHLLFQFTMLLVQLFEPLFGRGGGVAHALEEHVDQLVPCLDLGVMEETEQETPAVRAMQDRADITQVEAAASAANCAILVCAMPRRKGCGAMIDSNHEALRPLPEVFERRRHGVSLIR